MMEGDYLNDDLELLSEDWFDIPHPEPQIAVPKQNEDTEHAVDKPTKRIERVLAAKPQRKPKPAATNPKTTHKSSDYVKKMIDAFNYKYEHRVRDDTTALLPRPHEIMRILRAHKAYQASELEVIHDAEILAYDHIFNTFGFPAEGNLSELLASKRMKSKLDRVYQSLVSKDHVKIEHKKGRLHIAPAIYYLLHASAMYHNTTICNNLLLSRGDFMIKYNSMVSSLQSNSHEIELLYRACNIIRILLHILPAKGYLDMILIIVACLEGSGRKFQRGGKNKVTATKHRRAIIAMEDEAYSYGDKETKGKETKPRLFVVASKAA